MAADASDPDGNPVDPILDLVLFAPLGLAAVVRDQIPRLAAEGRKRFDAQARVARMVGEMAVRESRRQVATFVGRARPGPRPATTGEAAPSAAPGGWGERSSSAPGGADAADVPVADVAPGASWPGEAPGPPPVPPRPDASELAIPGYDSLSASQVVQRLPGLSPEELAVVRAYEAGGRARKTVLTRIHQLGA